jgi:Fe-S oxidoreductase
MKSMTDVRESVLKCNRCGNCQYYCPSFAVSRMETHVARGRLQLIKRGWENQSDAGGTYSKRVNQCLLCGNCTQNCPAGVNTQEAVEAARAHEVRRFGPSETMGLISGNISSVGNITGDGRENRLLWYENMEAGAVRSGAPAEYLYFAGCVPALYPSSYSIPQTFASLLNKADLDWVILGEKENCCSYPLMIGGMSGQALEVMNQNALEVAASGAKRLVTTCPSCYHMWKEIYPKNVANMPDIEIYHSTRLLAELVDKGALRLKETPGIVTYHDPCDLGRKSGIYDEPRWLINSIPGVKLIEMKFHGENAFCCGGGGNLEMNDSALSAKVAGLRVEQALATGAQTLITSCQQCKRTLMGGARQKRARIKIMDLSEFILNAIE